MISAWHQSPAREELWNTNQTAAMINTHNLFEAPLLEEQMDMYIKYENIESV